MEKVAIIGSGISGLGCAWFLHRNHEVTVFEAADYVGGHTNTITVDENGKDVPIDTGFMVFNYVTYPNLSRLFKELEVETKPSPMSFSVNDRPTGWEWRGSSLNTLFGQRKNIFRLRHWKFLLQLNRFNKEAVAALNEPQWQKMTLPEYVEARGYGEDFLERYLIPMSSAVWSSPRDEMLNFPAMTLLRFWHNHGFLGIKTQHPWRTVEGGSKSYVEKLTAPFKDRILTNTPVNNVRRDDEGIYVEARGRDPERFDKVIFATHAPQSLKILEKPSELESELLGKFRYQPNAVQLHKSPQFMPENKRCWASWNYRTDEGREATTHYWMNSLQGVSEKEDYFVSLNSESVPEGSCLREIDYEHPLFDREAVKAQSRLPELNRVENGNRTFFCGAWFRYGFHEDGLLSAVDLCRNLLGGDPWEKR